MSRQVWTEGQALTYEDLNNISTGLEETILGQAIRYILEEQQGFAGNAFKATRNSSTTFTLGTGLGLYIDDTQTMPEPKYRLLRNDNGATIHTITAPHSTLSRRDTVQVRAKIDIDATASRDVKDGVGTVTPTVVTIRKKWTFEIQIKDGTPAGSPTAPAVDAGWVKIAEILVSPGATGIANQAAITDSRTTLKLLLQAYTDISELDTRLDVVESVNGTQGTELAALDGRLDTIEGLNAGTRLTAIETLNTTQGNEISALDIRLDSVESVNSTQGSDISSLQTATGSVAGSEQDLWQWDTPRGLTNTVQASSNDLVFTISGLSGTSFNQRFGETVYGAMYWELRHYFGKGAALKITDGSGNAWYIIPRSSMASWTSHVELSGSVPGGSLTFKLKASGIGVLYDVYKGPSKTVMANFSTFTTLSSGSFTSNSFRIILYGTSSLLRKIDLFVPGPNLKRVWIKPLWCADILQSTANPQSANYRIAFDAGRTYRIAMIANFGYASGTFGNFTFHNHYSDFTTTYQINQIQQLTGAAGSYEDFHRFIDFVAVGEDLCIRYYQATGVGGAMGPVGGTIAGYHTWGFDHLLIEEV